MQVELVELKAGDELRAAELAELAEQIWLEHYTPIIGRPQVEYMLERFQSTQKIVSDIRTAGYRYYMAYADGKPAGYCAARLEQDSDCVFLSKLYVEKNYRGSGISRLMLNKLIALAGEHGLGSIWLTVNKYNNSSIEIYKKMGFAIVEEMVTDIGGGYVMDDYKMVLDIHTSHS